MKKILYPVLFIAAGLIVYEQSQPKPDIYVTVIAVITLMLGLMRLNARIPSKNHNSDGEV